MQIHGELVFNKHVETVVRLSTSILIFLEVFYRSGSVRNPESGGPMGPIGGPRDVYFDIFSI